MGILFPSFSFDLINTCMKVILSDVISDQTVSNYVARVLEKEWDEFSNLEAAEEEYENMKFYPDFSDLPNAVRQWLDENNFAPTLIFEDHEPLKLNFDDQHQAVLYQMRWG